MEQSRYVGHNITLLMEEKKVDIEKLASEIGYSVNDFKRLLDARLVMMPETVKKIASILNVNIMDILTERENSEYQVFVDCMTEFQHPENKDKILDIIDQYCNLQELLNK